MLSPTTRAPRPAARRAASLWLLLAVVAVLPGAAPAAAAQTGAETLYAAVLPDQRDAVRAETAGRLSRYRIEAALLPAAADGPTTVAGSLDLRFANGTGRELTEVFFRLYPNDEEYAEGGLTLDAVSVADRPVEPELSVADTVARVALPTPLADGERVDLRLDFTTTVPTDPAESYGIFSVAPKVGSVTLAHWYPLLAGYGPDGEWNLAPPSELGDPIFSNTALYDVRFTAPDGMVVVTTGTEVGPAASNGDRVRRRYTTGPVRDFILVADDDFARVSAEVDGTVVTSYFDPAHAEGGQRVLEYGVASLELFNGLLGAYPYAELDLVDVPLRNAGGVEFPQLLLIGAAFYDDRDVPPPTFLEDVVAHEVVHQWWYALVGNDQYRHAFIDEGLTNYLSSAFYFAQRYGPEVGDHALNRYLKLPYLRLLFDGGDAVVDQPTDDFPSGESYGVIVYSKGALGFDALRREIGDEAFFAALRAYAAEHRFAVAVPADLLAAFEAASGQDLDELWRHWFQAAEGHEDYDEDDLDDVQRALGG